MQRSDREHALFRLKNAPYSSRTTKAAIEWVSQDASEADLIEGLASRRRAPVSLEAFSALQSESQEIFEAVQGSIGRDLCKTYALCESLHRLPWYGGLRAFLSLPDPPQWSPCTYAFFILARNKIFFPPYDSGDPYEHCFHAMWRLAAMARTGNWHDADEWVLTVIWMLEMHLSRPEPDEFIVYFTALILGQMAPAPDMLENLRRHARQDTHPHVQRVARRTLGHLQTTFDLEQKWQAASQLAGLDKEFQMPAQPVRRFAVPATIGMLLASVAFGTIKHLTLTWHKLCE